MDGYELYKKHVCRPDDEPSKTTRDELLIGDIQAAENWPSSNDQAGQEDAMFYGLQDAAERGLIDQVEAYDLYASWARNRHSDMSVRHLGQQVARPFYE